MACEPNCFQACKTPSQSLSDRGCCFPGVRPVGSLHDALCIVCFTLLTLHNVQYEDSASAGKSYCISASPDLKLGEFASA